MHIIYMHIIYMHIIYMHISEAEIQYRNTVQCERYHDRSTLCVCIIHVCCCAWSLGSSLFSFSPFSWRRLPCNIFRAYLPKIICHHGLQPLYSIGHIVVCALFATVSALSSMSGHLSDTTFDMEAQMVSTLTA